MSINTYTYYTYLICVGDFFHPYIAFREHSDGSGSDSRYLQQVPRDLSGSPCVHGTLGNLGLARIVEIVLSHIKEYGRYNGETFYDRKHGRRHCDACRPSPLDPIVLLPCQLLVHIHERKHRVKLFRFYVELTAIF